MSITSNAFISTWTDNSRQWGRKLRSIKCQIWRNDWPSPRSRKRCRRDYRLKIAFHCNCRQLAIDCLRSAIDFPFHFEESQTQREFKSIEDFESSHSSFVPISGLIPQQSFYCVLSRHLKLELLVTRITRIFVCSSALTVPLLHANYFHLSELLNVRKLELKTSSENDLVKRLGDLPAGLCFVFKSFSSN